MSLVSGRVLLRGRAEKIKIKIAVICMPLEWNSVSLGSFPD